MILKRDVFMSYEFFPITWEDALQTARLNHKYIDFNGYVFDVNIESLDYDKAICKREDIIDDEMVKEEISKKEKTYIVVVSKGFGEYTDIFTLNTLEEAYEEVKTQLKDKIVETAEDYALVYELIPGQKNPKFICNDSHILDID